MELLDSVTNILGWCSVLNIGLLCGSALCVTLMRDTVMKIHARMFGVDEADLPGVYFRYLAQYKILVLIFNIVPYLALKIAST